MLSTDDPIIFIILTITISLAWAEVLFFRYLRHKGKHISHVITNSGFLRTAVYVTGLGFMGAVIYVTMETIEKLRKMK